MGMSVNEKNIEESDSYDERVQEVQDQWEREEISEQDAHNKQVFIIDEGIENGVFPATIHNHINRRKDWAKTYPAFWKRIKKSYNDEQMACGEIIDILFEGYGLKAKIEDYGNTDKGKVRIYNNSKRNLPDKKIIINDSDPLIVDIKNLQGGHYFKKHDLKSYRKHNAGMIIRTKVGTETEIYLYHKDAILKMLEKDKFFPHPPWEGKMVCHIGSLPKKSSFSHEELKSQKVLAIFK